MFENDHMLLESTRNMNEYKKLLINKFSKEYDIYFVKFIQQDEIDQINTGKY